MKELTMTRIENAIKKLQKLNTKLDRVNTALAGGANPYSYGEYDKRSVTREIKETEASLQKWTNKGKQEDKEERKEKVAAVEQFLATYRAASFNYYMESVATGANIVKEYHKVSGNTYNKEEYKKVQQYWRNHSVAYDLYCRGEADRLQTLNKLLDRDVEAKRNMIIARVEEKAGEIQDASGLYVAMNGEINGVIVGSKGNVVVETIGAGGYNIQRFHFRVLVK